MSLRQLQQLHVDRITAGAFFRATREERLAAGHYRALLLDLWHLRRHAPHAIALAGGRLVGSHPPLAEYLLAHASEEIGQDALLADLEDLHLPATARRGSSPSDAGLRLLGTIYLYAGHLDPVGLFGWLFMARSVGARLGGEVLGAIDRSAGLEGRGIRFLAAQSCADAEHADDLLGLVDVQLRSLADREHFVRALGLASGLYSELFDQAAGGRP